MGASAIGKTAEYLTLVLSGRDVVTGPEVSNVLRVAGLRSSNTGMRDALAAVGFWRVDPPVLPGQTRRSVAPSRVWGIPGASTAMIYLREDMSPTTRIAAQRRISIAIAREESRGAVRSNGLARKNSAAPRAQVLNRLRRETVRIAAVRNYLDELRIEWRKTHPDKRTLRRGTGRPLSTRIRERANQRAINRRIELRDGPTMRPHSDLGERAAARREATKISNAELRKMLKVSRRVPPGQVPPVPGVDYDD